MLELLSSELTRGSRLSPSELLAFLHYSLRLPLGFEISMIAFQLVVLSFAFTCIDYIVI